MNTQSKRKEKANELLKILEQEFSCKAEQLLREHSETIYHMVRCSEVANLFGLHLGLPNKEREILSKCALLHDIGKFSIPKNILYKKEGINEEEFSIIKTHVFYEFESIKDEVFAHSIKYHHCRPEGSGYGWDIPYEQIHPYAKIISLLDVYDVLTHRRCYKTHTMNIDSVIKEIEKNVGIQFDLFFGNEFISFLMYSEMELKEII